MQVPPTLVEQNIDWTISNLADIPGRISDDQAVQWLKSRALSGNCYTWAGVALLAINAGQESTLDFSESARERFRKYDGNTAVPHPYAVAARAHHRLVNEVGRKNQAIVISGDSGSGKTFCASHVLNLLITHGLSGVETSQHGLHKIWTSVPILMAFGNAQTECNANSSRFGKLIQLQYQFGIIRGAYLKGFLLETTRVAAQGKGQRNFHVFHQLIAGLHDKELASLNLSQSAKYKIIPGDILESDSRRYNETTSALIDLGMKPEELYEVHVVLAAIAHLGNISFGYEDDPSVIVIDQKKESKDSFEAACKLLGLSVATLSKLLTTSVLAPQSASHRCTIYHVPIPSAESCQARTDCLMRLLYEKLFHWLVDFINKQIQIAVSGNCIELGILDIYGFENFKSNSLEQLCINYANERLQSYFVKNFIEHAKMTLQLEFEEDENFSSSNSSEQALNVFHAPSMSLFAILNEESMLSRHTSDLKVWEKIRTNLAEYKILVPTKYSPDNPQFTVSHYAGKVCYDVKDICEKNLDKVPSELQGYFKMSVNSFIVHLIDDKTKGNLKHSTKKTTVINKYHSSLDTLLSTLDAADIHFIRCVKATENLEPGKVEVPYFKQQLVASGIMALIPLNSHRFRHFPYWFKSSDFSKRYRTLLSTAPAHSLAFVRLMKENEEMDNHIKVGRESIFVSEAGISKLEEWKQKARNNAAFTIQRAWRNYSSKKKHVAAKRNNNATFQDSQLTPAIGKSEEKNPSSHQAGGYRTVFFGDCIRSRLRLAKVPIRFHTRKTCIPLSHNLPFSELPQGLEDAL